MIVPHLGHLMRLPRSSSLSLSEAPQLVQVIGMGMARTPKSLRTCLPKLSNRERDFRIFGCLGVSLDDLVLMRVRDFGVFRCPGAPRAM